VQIPLWYVTLRNQCPRCGAGVRLRGSYFRVLWFIALLIAGLALSALGVNAGAFMSLLLPAAFMIVIVLVRITIRLFPPDIEPTGDFRGVLYGAPSEAAVVQAAEPVAEPAEPASVQGHRMFESARLPMTLEGMLILLIALFVTVGAAHALFGPLIARLWPDTAVTRLAPQGFPISVTIREDDIQVTNASKEPWTCTARIGRGLPFESNFAVAAHGTDIVPFDSFRLTRSMDTVQPLREFALARIQMECSEPSGLTHFADL
jgi:hypothetical protein